MNSISSLKKNRGSFKTNKSNDMPDEVNQI